MPSATTAFSKTTKYFYKSEKLLRELFRSACDVFWVVFKCQHFKNTYTCLVLFLNKDLKKNHCIKQNVTSCVFSI